MQSFLLIFLDGVGIGLPDKKTNPFFEYPFKTFTEIFGKTPEIENPFLQAGEKFVFPIDANLGIDGLPQSGTGQTSIFTGINAPKFIGKHFGPFPYSTLIPIIKEKNIFKELLSENKKVIFANAYPKVFFDYINSGKRRLDVFSLSCLLSGVSFRNSNDLQRGKAISADISNMRWITKLNYKLPLVKPETAVKRLLRLTGKNHFTLFEFFYTDHLCHGRMQNEFFYYYNILDQFLYYLITTLPEEITLLICSDHGNIEDLSIKSHTRNPALGITAGKYARFLSENIKSLDNIKGSILSILE